MAFNPAATHRAQARVGQVLNEKWRLDSLLGIGGMAAVYGASHRNGKRAALKILHTELVVDPSLVTRFMREGYLANRVEHPGVVSVLDDAYAEDGSPYLVMELLEGYSLERHTHAPEHALPLRQVLQIADELLDVLAAAHAIGIVHRDIKPANLFLTRDNKLKVLDFGIARLAETSGDSALTQTGAAIGTPSYMPPEQARGRWSEVDARTDLWSVGATILALLLGQRPRRGETVQEELLLAMTAPMTAAATLCPGLPERVCEAIDCAVAFERERRYPDAKAMQEAFRISVDPTMDALALDRTLLVQHSADTAPVMHPGVVAVVQDRLSNPLAGSVMAPSGSGVQLPTGSQPPHVPHPVGSSPITSPSQAQARVVANANLSANQGSGSYGSTVHLAEPQLTTGRPMSFASHAPSAPPPARSGAGFVVATLLGLVLAGGIVGGVTWKKHQAKVIASEAHDPPPPPVLTTTSTAAVAAPPASVDTTPSATTSASALASSSAAPARSAAPRSSGARAGTAAPRGSAAPSDTSGFFNQRF